MKFRQLLLILLVSSTLFGMSNYVVGYRYYIMYIKHIPGHAIKAPKLLQKLNVHTPEELNKLFENNGKLLIEKTKQFNPEAAKGLEKIIKKGKLKQLQVFLTAIINGRIPPG